MNEKNTLGLVGTKLHCHLLHLRKIFMKQLKPRRVLMIYFKKKLGKIHFFK